ncbi:MAG: hypothetical protein GX660_26275 [Clostridiaceae bacterium]|nr:hypothetical protein [Clostridiaceae bacterium]
MINWIRYRGVAKIRVKYPDKTFIGNYNYLWIRQTTVYITISVDIFDSDLTDSPFYIFASITGEFEFDGNDKIEKQILLDKNAVAIMFPYLRSTITNITSIANIPPLVLPVVNITKLL